MSKSWIWDIPHYYIPFMEVVPEEDCHEALKLSLDECNRLLLNVSEEQSNRAYEEGKWTLKEVVQHVCDTERIFNYRALCISRGEQSKLSGFDQDQYTKNANCDHRRLSDIVVELNAVRNSSRALFRSFTEEQMKMRGHANGFEVQPIFYAYLLSGHMRHHMNVIKERYL